MPLSASPSFPSHAQAGCRLPRRPGPLSPLFSLWHPHPALRSCCSSPPLLPPATRPHRPLRAASRDGVPCGSPQPPLQPLTCAPRSHRTQRSTRAIETAPLLPSAADVHARRPQAPTGAAPERRLGLLPPSPFCSGPFPSSPSRPHATPPARPRRADARPQSPSRPPARTRRTAGRRRSRTRPHTSPKMGKEACRERAKCRRQRRRRRAGRCGRSSVGQRWRPRDPPRFPTGSPTTRGQAEAANAPCTDARWARSRRCRKSAS